MGEKVIAAGRPVNSDGYMMVPLAPSGAAEVRFFNSTGNTEEPAEDGPTPFVFSDAHCHLDQVLLSRRYGNSWFYKTMPCRRNPCPFGNKCIWVHAEAETRPRPSIDIGDLSSLLNDINSLRGGRFLGCVQSCCGTDSIDITLELVRWGRKLMDGRLYASFGVHPSTYEEWTPDVEARLILALDECGPQGVAWGECGLDYNKRSTELEGDTTSLERMREVFAQQARLAVSRGLPLVIHSRDATDDTLKIMRETVPRDHPVYLHSFMGTPDEMATYMNGWTQCYIGITGAATWPVAIMQPDGIRDLVRAVPLDRFLLETDGPFMVVTPFYGEESHSGHIPWVADSFATFKRCGVDEVLSAAHANFCRFYRIAPP